MILKSMNLLKLKKMKTEICNEKCFFLHKNHKIYNKNAYKYLEDDVIRMLQSSYKRLYLLSTVATSKKNIYEFGEELSHCENIEVTDLKMLEQIDKMHQFIKNDLNMIVPPKPKNSDPKNNEKIDKKRINEESTNPEPKSKKRQTIRIERKIAEIVIVLTSKSAKVLFAKLPEIENFIKNGKEFDYKTLVSNTITSSDKASFPKVFGKNIDLKT